MWTAPILPQNDKNRKSREKEIEKEQRIYRYKYTYSSLETIPMADGVPSKELPHYKWIVQLLEIIEKLMHNHLENNFIDKEDSLLLKEKNFFSELKLFKEYLFELKSDIKDDDILKISQLLKHFEIENKITDKKTLKKYNSYFKAFKIPSISKDFQSDLSFVARRVAGQNPVVLKSIKKVNQFFSITNDTFKTIKGFKNDDLSTAENENRFYIADYKALKKIKNGSNEMGQKYSYAPKALFALEKDAKEITTALRPIAILCGQNEDEKNIILTPNDGYAWKIAKTIVEIADLNHHELVTHLGATHLLIEPFVITTHRKLATKHPLKVLLLPHFEGTILINWGAQEFLVSDGGSFDTLFAGTMDTNREVVANRLGKSFDNAMLPNDLKRRGVESKALSYPYRDDALKIWGAIEHWVASYLSTYYLSNDDVVNDTELQNWVEEIITDGKVKGFGQKGKIKTLDYLKDVVTMLIFTSSAQHAAVNFTQRDFSGYIPNMPAAGYTPAPTHKNKTKQDWLDLLPPINMANQQVDLMQLLSGVNYTTLGGYKWSYFEDYRLVISLHRFKTRLKKIEEEILDRNANNKKLTYSYLLPSKIPQSINI